MATESRSHERPARASVKEILQASLEDSHARSAAFARDIERTRAGDFRYGGKSSGRSRTTRQVDRTVADYVLNVLTEVALRRVSRLRSTKWRAFSRRRRRKSLRAVTRASSPITRFVEIHQERRKRGHFSVVSSVRDTIGKDCRIAGLLHGKKDFTVAADHGLLKMHLLL